MKYQLPSAGYPVYILVTKHEKFFECVHCLPLCSRCLNGKNLFPSSHQIKYITKHFENTLFSSSGEAPAQKHIKEAKFRKWIVELGMLLYVGGPKINRTGFGERFLIVVEWSPAR